MSWRARKGKGNGIINIHVAPSSKVVNGSVPLGFQEAPCLEKMLSRSD